MQTAISKLTKKYQATVPEVVRKKLELNAGDAIAFEVDKDIIKLRKANVDTEPGFITPRFHAQFRSGIYFPGLFKANLDGTAVHGAMIGPARVTHDQHTEYFVPGRKVQLLHNGTIG